ncbi:hypothetical protein CTI12_AA214530 [Artemisia annua]|uniref:CCHC-type domain-containing protein n=1 Tax=Artemisia annua TaxID=35608 RepID=A0A2U1NY92_ARTAN|nr:hypothetical protein CTI12_AA214530 [Artemisia annua]
MVATRRNGEGDGPDFEAMINAALANALPNLSTELRTQIYNDIRNGAAEDWITHMEKLFQVLGCPDNFKTRLAAFKLEGDALSWWTAHLRTQAGGEAYADTCTWATFREIFYNRYFPVSEQQRFEREYGSICQQERENSVEYMQRFMRLVSFVGPVAGDAQRQARHFKWGLKRWVLDRIVNTEYPDVAQACAAARNIELLHESGPSNKRDRDGNRIQHRGQGNQEYRGRSDQVQEYRGRSDQGQSYRGQHDRQRNDRRGYNNNNGQKQWKDQSTGYQQNRASGSSSQNRSAEILPPPPLCPSCGKPHPGPCYRSTGGCFHCGSTQHKVKDCPKQKAIVPANNPKPPTTTGRVFSTTRDQAAHNSGGHYNSCVADIDDTKVVDLRLMKKPSVDTAVVDILHREVGHLSTRKFAYRLAASEGWRIWSIIGPGWKFFVREKNRVENILGCVNHSFIMRDENVGDYRISILRTISDFLVHTLRNFNYMLFLLEIYWVMEALFGAACQHTKVVDIHSASYLGDNIIKHFDIHWRCCQGPFSSLMG